MDDAPFSLSEPLVVLHQAGIRHVLPGPEVSLAPSLLSSEPWPQVLAKLPPRPACLWTYGELGSDLTGQSNPERGNLWRTLLKHLELPRGFVGFLPYCLPKDGGQELCLDHFGEALSAVCPQTVLLFDDDPANPLAHAFKAFPASPHSPDAQGQPRPAVTLVVAPSPKALLELSPQELQAVAAGLKVRLYPGE